jgi:hypothetical protein
MMSQASRLLDTVDEMLLDAGREQDAELRAALLSLGSLASLPAPIPNAQLAALLGCRPDELTWRRRLRRHRPTIVSLAVVAGMGLGVTGVAATASSPEQETSVSIQHLLEDWAPSWNLSGLPSAAPATGLVPEPAPPAGQEAAADSGAAGGQQESPANKVPDQPAVPAKSPGATAKTGPGDGGADARDAPGSAAAGTESAAKEPDTEAKVASEPDTLQDSADAAAKAQETARQALEKSGKLLSGVVPGNAVSGEQGNGSAKKSGSAKKADPGAKWLKKFNR